MEGKQKYPDNIEDFLKEIKEICNRGQYYLDFLASKSVFSREEWEQIGRRILNQKKRNSFE